MSGALAAQSTNTNPRDFSTFKIITDRNIFNSRRSPRYVPSERRETRRTSRSESFALVGTMNYEKGPFAFFDGSRSDYRKVLKRDDTIAGFKILSIDRSSVKLASPTNEIDLSIGKQLRREEEGEWHMSARTETSEAAPPRTVASGNAETNGLRQAESLPPGSDAASPAPARPAAAPGSDADILERLRQRAAAERGESP